MYSLNNEKNYSSTWFYNSMIHGTVWLLTIKVIKKIEPISKRNQKISYVKIYHPYLYSDLYTEYLNMHFSKYKTTLQFCGVAR